MSGESAISSSERPYTVGSFQNKLNQFQDLMKDITLQDVEATPEEKRQMITGERKQYLYLKQSKKISNGQELMQSEMDGRTAPRTAAMDTFR